MTLPLEAHPPPLETDDDGVVRVAGTRVTLDTVVQAFSEGQSPEEIQREHPSLKLPAVYATISYYLSHQKAVARYLDERAAGGQPGPSPRQRFRALAIACLAFLAMMALYEVAFEIAWRLEPDDSRFYYRHELRKVRYDSMSRTGLAARLHKELSGAEVRVEAGEDGVYAVVVRGPRSVFDFEHMSQVLQQSGYSTVVVNRRIEYQLREAIELPERPMRELPLLLAGSTVMILLTLLLQRWSGIGLPWSTGSFGLALFVGTGVACALWVVDGAFGAILHALGWPPYRDLWSEDVAATGGWTLVAASIYIVVVGPVAEELFFRGWMFTYLDERAGPLAAYLASSLLFAIYHLEPSGLPLYAISGILFAQAARKSGHILTPILAHALFNGFIVLTSMQ